MGRKALFKQAVPLLVAAGLFAVLVAGISADDGDEEAVAARVLEPTEVVAEIPEEYDTLFQVQWGGGSLFQLAGRLASQGCAMNTLWVHDGRQWHPYNRYDVPRDAALIQEFIRLYERNLPVGTFYATCTDQPDAQNLQPTQIVAEIPEEYDTLFELQWGGGSLLHFKGRLATMGCMANNIQFSDPATGTRYVYNQYNTRSTDPTNQQFIQTFERYMPSGAIQADCYNVCEFKGRECLSFEEAREQHNNWTISDISGVPCTDDFHPTVQEKVFPVLPIRPNTCIIRAEKRFSDNRRGGAIMAPYNIVHPAIFILNGNNSYRSWTNERSDLLLHTEVHELCHMNQQWQWTQQLALNKSYNDSLDELANYFFNSPYGKQFIEAIGYDNIPPIDTPYRDLYDSFNKKEISAELCALYILDKAGAKNRYGYERWDNSKGHLVEVPIRDFDTSKYLTPQIVEWLETYIILPDIEEDGEESTE